MGQLCLGYESTITEAWYADFMGYPSEEAEFTTTTPGGVGSYTLNDGTLLVTGGEIIGVNGTGVFTQNGGTHTVTGDIILGQKSGTYSWTKQEDDGTSTAFHKLSDYEKSRILVL
jgi:hypothetical protein